ncbi:hypothetical protein M405DRAFT_868575 [Rhizopogon salebrosus TDB-379]|nr:hypothetical protein M405DRAFT_868575 [Rhizopogon salebrosus TDB-379]
MPQTMRASPQPTDWMGGIKAGHQVTPRRVIATGGGKTSLFFCCSARLIGETAFGYWPSAQQTVGIQTMTVHTYNPAAQSDYGNLTSKCAGKLTQVAKINLLGIKTTAVNADTIRAAHERGEDPLEQIRASGGESRALIDLAADSVIRFQSNLLLSLVYD